MESNWKCESVKSGRLGNQSDDHRRSSHAFPSYNLSSSARRGRPMTEELQRICASVSAIHVQ